MPRTHILPAQVAPSAAACRPSPAGQPTGLRTGTTGGGSKGGPTNGMVGSNTGGKPVLSTRPTVRGAAAGGLAPVWSAHQLQQRRSMIQQQEQQQPACVGSHRYQDQQQPLQERQQQQQRQQQQEGGASYSDAIRQVREQSVQLAALQQPLDLQKQHGPGTRAAADAAAAVESLPNSSPSRVSRSASSLSDAKAGAAAAGPAAASGGGGRAGRGGRAAAAAAAAAVAAVPASNQPPEWVSVYAPSRTAPSSPHKPHSSPARQLSGEGRRRLTGSGRDSPAVVRNARATMYLRPGLGSPSNNGLYRSMPDASHLPLGLNSSGSKLAQQVQEQQQQLPQLQLQQRQQQQQQRKQQYKAQQSTNSYETPVPLHSRALNPPYAVHPTQAGSNSRTKAPAAAAAPDSGSSLFGSNSCTSPVVLHSRMLSDAYSTPTHSSRGTSSSTPTPLDADDHSLPACNLMAGASPKLPHDRTSEDGNSDDGRSSSSSSSVVDLDLATVTTEGGSGWSAATNGGGTGPNRQLLPQPQPQPHLQLLPPSAVAASAGWGRSALMAAGRAQAAAAATANPASSTEHGGPQPQPTAGGADGSGAAWGRSACGPSSPPAAHPLPGAGMVGRGEPSSGGGKRWVSQPKARSGSKETHRGRVGAGAGMYTLGTTASSCQARQGAETVQLTSLMS
ncbi:MAG: hypothetical protein WDW38_005345 [Sanguina aurantia]